MPVVKREIPKICCPDCGSGLSRVVDSRDRLLRNTIPTIRRRRQCLKCTGRYSTVEVTESDISELVREQILKAASSLS